MEPAHTPDCTPSAPPATPDPGAWRRVGLAMFTIGFGANLFAPMLEVYRSAEGIGQPSVTAMLGVYAAGLVPALLLAGRASDRLGRSAILRPALLLAGAGSAVLAAGAALGAPALFAGRCIVGAGVGMAMACGAAWIKELSADRPAAGPRRATAAVSAGFGGGPLVSGLVAEFAPAPELTPYLVHLALVALVAPLLRAAPETRPPAPGRPGSRPALIPPAARTRAFGWAVAAWAPWVFGCVTVAFALLPVLVLDQVRLPVAYSGLIAFLAMGSGAAVQPAAARLAAAGWLPLSVIGLGAAAAGMLGAAATAAWPHPLAVPPVAALLGCSYGVMMVAGLHEVALISPPAQLGALIGVFYALTYLGFAAPFVLSLLAPPAGAALGGGPAAGYAALLLAGAAIAAGSAVPVGRVAARAARDAGRTRPA
ncbi:MFS transporter [Corynebacterium sphenisci]|nr:MFS transporter [Corynebacterium sphenisci]